MGTATGRRLNKDTESGIQWLSDDERVVSICDELRWVGRDDRTSGDTVFDVNKARKPFRCARPMVANYTRKMGKIKRSASRLTKYRYRVRETGPKRRRARDD